MDPKPSREELLAQVKSLRAQVADAKRIEHALKESEARYRRLSENLPVAVYSALPDRTSSSFFISGRMEELTGYPAANFILDAEMFLRIIHPDDRQTVGRQIHEALKNKQTLNLRYRIITKDQQIKWIRDTATPIYANGELLRIEGFMEDITENHRAEQALEKASRQWQETFDAMSEALAILDKDCRILRCNRAMVALLQKPETKIMGEFCWKVIHDTDSPIPQCPSPKARLSGQRESTVVEVGERIFEVAVDPQFDSEGRLSSFIHIMSDITEQRRAENALRESHHTLLTVLDSIDATIYVADLNTFEILFMNRYMKETFNGDFTGMSCWKAFRNGSSPCKGCTNAQLIDDQGKPTGVCIYEGRNPITGRWYLNHDRAIKWVDGRYVRLQVATDISDIKAMEQERISTETQLRQAQKMEAIGTLAGGIAHDFNNILSAILGYSELALDDAVNGRASANYIRQILSAGQRARDLVQQILTFSRQTETEAKPIQVRPIVKEALKLLRASLPSSIEIQTQIESGAIVQADPIQIHQVIMNLCTNAGHAMRQEGGTLTVGLSEEYLDKDFTDHYPDMMPGDYLRLEVTDTGHGIEPAIIDKIYDPYFTTKEKGEGTGMGLAVVQGIIQTCGGAVAVASTPDVGTTFKVYLPIIHQENDMEALSDVVVPRGEERILFVDDEPPLAELGKMLLERLGYHVTIRTSSTEALALFQAQPFEFDLVITDMTMPHMTGEILAQKLLNIRPNIPIIICTGYSQKITQELIDRLGIQALVMKPLIRSELGLAVRQALDHGKG